MNTLTRRSPEFEIMPFAGSLAGPLAERELGLGDLFGRIGSGISDVAGKLADTLRSAGIIDLTAQADKSVRHGARDLKKVQALVLHQMACCHHRKDPLKNYLKLKAHFAILPDGRILQVHPVQDLIWASNGFNNGSVAVEFAGNFPNTKGKWWEGVKFGRNQVTSAQVEAGRRLIRHLVGTIGLRTVLAHRQSSATRENDPGPDIWYHVGQWAVDTLGLKDGGPGFKVGDGNAIPDLWRTWGRTAPAAPPSKEFEGELEGGRGGEANLLAGLIRGGQRDENKLTDSVFGLRHPERAARAITVAETALAAEWMTIRSSLVGPALRSVGVTAVDVRPYRPLLPLLQKYRGDAPLDFLLGWIAVESGGDIQSTTSLDERGYFQLHPEESKTLGVDHARLSTDADYSVQKGIALARYQAGKVARQFGYAPGSAMSWPLSKLLHWLPLGVQVIMDSLKAQGRRATTWDELRSFVLANQEAIQKEITRRDVKHRSWPPARGIANVDKVLQRGREIAQALGLGGSPQNESEEVFENEFEQETAFGPLTARLGWLPRPYPYAAVAARGGVFENFGGVYIAFLPAPAGGKPKFLKVGLSDTFARRMRDAKYVAWSRSHPGLSFYLAQVHGQRDKYGVAGVVRMVEYALARLLRRAGELAGPQLPNQPAAARGPVQIGNILPAGLQALLAPALGQSRAGGSNFGGSMPPGQLALPAGFRWEAEQAAHA